MIESKYFGSSMFIKPKEFKLDCWLNSFSITCLSDTFHFIKNFIKTLIKYFNSSHFIESKLPSNRFA